MFKQMRTSKSSQRDLAKLCKTSNQLHMLYSMLPKQYSLYQQTQFKKTKDFYRPGQFIWNNPHRTSDRLYKYYHQGIQQYKTIKQPQIIQKQQEHQQTKQFNRIVELSKKRQQARAKFYSKKLQRIQMQEKIGIKRTTSNQLTNREFSKGLINEKQLDRFEQKMGEESILKRSSSQFLRKPSSNDMKTTFLYRKIKTKGQQISLNQKSYLSSVENFDMKKTATIQILKQSQKQMKNKIRQNFMRQKQNNTMNQSNSSFQSKLLKSTLTKKLPTKCEFFNNKSKHNFRKQFELERC